MYHMDADKTYRKKVRRDLHKNITRYTEQILKTSPNNGCMATYLPSLKPSK